MPLETNVNGIQDLNPSWPVGTDPVSEGDNHDRITKDAIQKSFPGMTAAWTTTSVITCGGVDAGGGLVVNLGTPVNATDAARKGDVDALNTLIDDNAAAIAANAADIANNAGNISTNASNIAANAANIANNDTAISGLDSRVTTNEGNISTNTSNIATNTANIAANTNALAAIPEYSGGSFAGTGAIQGVSSGDFTVTRTATGVYRVDFSKAAGSAFAHTVTANTQNGNNRFCTVTYASATRVVIEVINAANGNNIDEACTFMRFIHG